MLVNHTDQQVCHNSKKLFFIRFFGRIKVTQMACSIPTPPSGTVRGVTLLSATDGLSSPAQSLHINTHTHAQSSTKVQNSTNTPTQARTHIHYTHINKLAAVTQTVRGAFRQRFVPVMRQQEEEQGRRQER